MGHTEEVKLLIYFGLNVNDTINNGSTPLCAACQNAHYDILKFLLNLKAQTLIQQSNIIRDDQFCMYLALWDTWK